MKYLLGCESPPLSNLSNKLFPRVDNVPAASEFPQLFQSFLHENTAVHLDVIQRFVYVFITNALVLLNLYVHVGQRLSKFLGGHTLSIQEMSFLARSRKASVIGPSQISFPFVQEPKCRQPHFF